MNSPGNHIEQVILEKAKEFGASLAGIAKIADLKASPSYKAYARKPFYEEYEQDHPNYFKFKGVEWKKEHKSDKAIKSKYDYKLEKKRLKAERKE